MFGFFFIFYFLREQPQRAIKKLVSLIIQVIIQEHIFLIVKVLRRLLGRLMLLVPPVSALLYPAVASVNLDPDGALVILVVLVTVSHCDAGSCCGRIVGYRFLLS